MTPTPADLDRYAANVRDEIDSAHVYRTLAVVERDTNLSAVYTRLAETEERHARFWAEKISAAGGRAPPQKPTWRARVLAGLARRFSSSMVAAIVAEAEIRDQGMYDDQPEAAGTSLAADERSHARVLQVAVASERPLPGPAVARLEGRHRTAVSGNALRAAVLGANDGLVSNLSLVTGVAGASDLGSPVLVAGIAGLVAGSISMALGEWISVQSSREATKRQLSIERQEIEEAPEEERDELVLIAQSRGLTRTEAERYADSVFAMDPDVVLDVLAREELGIDPDERGASPWTAAIASFVLFAVGAAVPVIPFVVGSGRAAVVAALAASGVALFILGAAITVLTGRSAVRSGLRQLGFGMAAATVTFGIGSLVGATLL